MVRKGLRTGKTVKRTVGTDFLADCLGTAEGNIHIVLRNFKSVRVRPFAKVAFRTLCNVLQKCGKSLEANWPHDAGWQTIRGRKTLSIKGRK